ncbi:hypothetical protein [Pseudoalteromonas rubra]|uniref:hypothetical protein n=1 Tax=Pseudoalteromonas rubra TaxID=43658 RepID=UPI000A681970|nr:hypothetical protein [Pseudoalteromonas rubra]
MQHWVSRVRLLSFAALMSRKALILLLFVLRHPVRTAFLLLKTWLVLILFTVFSFGALANLRDEYDLMGLSPKIETVGEYQCHTSSTGVSVGTSMLAACQSTWHSIFGAQPDGEFCAWSVEFDGYDAIYTVGRGTQEHCPLSRYSISMARTAKGLGGQEQRKTCPPDDSPLHRHKMSVSCIGDECFIDSSQPEMCYKKLSQVDKNERPKSCSSMVGNNDGFYGVKVDNATHPDSSKLRCVENGTDSTGQTKYCEVTSQVWIDQYSTDSHTYWSPVGGGTFTGASCHNAESPMGDYEDRFCTTTSSSGIIRVECPTSDIAINWNTVEGLAQASALDNQRIAAIEASYISQEQLNQLAASGQLKGEQGEQGEQGLQGEQGEQGLRGLDGRDGEDGEDGIGCSVVNTPNGATITCAESSVAVNDGEDGEKGEDGEDGKSCSVSRVNGHDARIACDDGSVAEVNGVDEDGIIEELSKQTEILEGLGGTGDGELPTLNTSDRPDAWSEIANFDWENENFGTVLENHVNEIKSQPIFSAVDGFFDASFGGSCPTWSTSVNVMGASFDINIDQFCSPAVQGILPYIAAILQLCAGFFAWRIAIE